MLGNLLKYEFKATGRILLPLYGAILLVALVGGLALDKIAVSDWAAVIFSLVYFGLFVSLIVLTIVLIIQRFSNNLLKDEGYLMFTLPVSTHSLIWSKLISSVVWCIVGSIVGGLSVFFLMMFSITPDLWLELRDIWRELLNVMTLDNIGTMCLTLVAMLCEYITFLLTVYLSLSIGQVPAFNRHRGLFSFISFFVISIVTSVISGVVGDLLGMDMYYSYTQLNSVMTYTIGLNIVFGAILYFGTNYILSRKLNLE